jgi:hypothetical protein
VVYAARGGHASAWDARYEAGPRSGIQSVTTVPRSVGPVLLLITMPPPWAARTSCTSRSDTPVASPPSGPEARSRAWTFDGLDEAVPAQHQQPVRALHGSPPCIRPQYLMSMAAVMRSSVLTRSGAQPVIIAPGLPLSPPGGVTPFGPVKYGTLAARCVYSVRHVKKGRGM